MTGKKKGEIRVLGKDIGLEDKVVDTSITVTEGLLGRVFLCMKLERKWVGSHPYMVITAEDGEYRTRGRYLLDSISQLEGKVPFLAKIELRGSGKIPALKWVEPTDEEVAEWKKNHL